MKKYIELTEAREVLHSSPVALLGGAEGREDDAELSGDHKRGGKRNEENSET